MSGNRALRQGTYIIDNALFAAAEPASEQSVCITMFLSFMRLWIRQIPSESLWNPFYKSWNKVISNLVVSWTEKGNCKMLTDMIS